MGTTYNNLRTFALKPRPESGPDCVICATFALNATARAGGAAAPGHGERRPPVHVVLLGLRVSEMCSGSEAGSYLRRVDFVYHSTLEWRVIKKKRRHIVLLGLWALGLRFKGLGFRPLSSHFFFILR